jgi:AcrR family transcriptional regulator
MRDTNPMKNIRFLKENEFRDDVRKNRERFMLEKAREILNQAGFGALNLPELAKLTGYSKPTIYKYFPNKEELMVALATESTEKQVAFLERAITFNGRPREKIHGIHSLNTGILYESLRDALLIHTDRIRSRATPERQQLLDGYEERRIEILAGIVREAVSNGDLKLPDRVNEYELQFTLMATNFGGMVMQESDSPVMGKWFEKIKFSHGMFGRIVLDGMGWRPLSAEWHYSETIRRFYQEVFPELVLEESKTSKNTAHQG